MILDWISGLFDKDKEKETKTEQPAATSANTAQEAPTTTTSTVTSTKKEDDPFLQGFNYYDNDGKSLPGSFPKQAVRRSVTKPIDSPIVVNKKEDPFLAGFNYYDNEERAGQENKTKNQWTGSQQSTASSLTTKPSVKDAQKKEETTFWTEKSLGGKADKLGILDDVTNSLFKVYDKFVNTDVWDIAFKNSANGFNFGRDIANHLIAEHNYKKNQEVDLSNYENSGGYINDQKRPSRYCTRF